MLKKLMERHLLVKKVSNAIRKTHDSKWGVLSVYSVFNIINDLTIEQKIKLWSTNGTPVTVYGDSLAKLAIAFNPKLDPGFNVSEQKHDPSEPRYADALEWFTGRDLESTRSLLADPSTVELGNLVTLLLNSFDKLTLELPPQQRRATIAASRDILKRIRSVV